MKKKVEKKSIKKSASKFRSEFKKSVITGITAAFGFLIALVWRDAIVEYVDKLVLISPIQGKLFSAIIVTIIAVIGILIVSKFSPEDKK